MPTEADLAEILKNNPHLRVKEDKPQSKPSSPASEIIAKAIQKPKPKMSKVESAYAEHLTNLQRIGEIVWWEFHAIKLKLAETCWYEIDFLVIDKDLTIQCHETKGRYAFEDSIVKFKVATAHYPFLFKFVRRNELGGWEVRDGNQGNIFRAKKENLK